VERRGTKPGIPIFNSTTFKKSGKVDFNFTPVRKTFDAEEVELLEKATEDVSLL
jgi:hypothetical protein